MRHIIYIFFVILFSSSFIFSQDTINVMHYNLLNYGLPVYGCDNANNNPDDKDLYLNTIIDYFNPDIFTVNELRSESYDTTYANRILDNVLNENGPEIYQRANITNLAQSHIINMLYYNSNKLQLYSQDANAAYRDINIYTLYYKAADLSELADTTFITCFVVHLKSSQGSDNEAIRADMTEKIMQYISENQITENVLLMGDFNVYSPQEEGFQNLINPDDQNIKFYDPIDEIGEWHNNSDYAHVHTQSTHTEYNGCAASGGMDDRFDMILFNQSILNDLDGLSYIDGSYQALGNDGTCFNESLLECGNSNLSSDLKNALYSMSDHLPILLQLYTEEQTGSSVRENFANGIDFTFNNPATDNIQLKVNDSEINYYSVEIISIIGQVVYSSTDFKNELSIPVQSFKNGLYILKISDIQGNVNSKKLIIEN
jgi:Secretion system C-terminal sorting domain